MTSRGKSWAKAVQAHAAGVVVHDLQKHTGTMLAAHGVDTSWNCRYGEYYAGLNMWTERAGHLWRPGTVGGGDQLIPWVQPAGCHWKEPRRVSSGCAPTTSYGAMSTCSSDPTIVVSIMSPLAVIQRAVPVAADVEIVINATDENCRQACQFP